MEHPMLDTPRLDDGFTLSLQRGRSLGDDLGILGRFCVELFDEHGQLKHSEEGSNLITDAGDLYIAGKVIVGISPANASAPTAMNGMKLGTGTTAVAKSGAGAALVTYLSGSNVAFDSSYPQTSNLGGGLGVTAVYKTTWAAGVATNSAITEAVIVNDQATNATTSAANTISRIVFTAVNKGASDTLAITWSHKFLGA
jgi:hypothetical protein